MPVMNAPALKYPLFPEQRWTFIGLYIDKPHRFTSLQYLRATLRLVCGIIKKNGHMAPH